MRALNLLLILLPFAGACAQTAWTPIGPPGGYFKEFVIDPIDPMVVYTGSDDGGGIWKSTDGGGTWTLLTAAFPNMTGWKLSFEPGNSNTIYACDLYGRYGLLRSTDAGSTWTLLNNGLSSAYDKMVSGLIAYDSDTLFVSTGESYNTTPPRPGNGMFRSFNGGALWQPTGLQDTATTCIGTNLFKTLFVGTNENGLFYSNDRGATWIPHPDIPLNDGIHAIKSDSNVVIVGANGGVYLSTDHGITFTNTGLSGQFNFDVAIHRRSPQIELFSSSINGLQHYVHNAQPWNLVGDPLLNGQLVIGIASDGTNVYLSTFSNNLMIRSTDGGTTWHSIVQSPTATEVNDVILDPTNSSNILAAMMGSYTVGGGFNRNAVRSTTDGGTTWTFKGPEAHGVVMTANPLDPNSAFLGTFSQGLFKTHDRFDTYTQLIGGNILIADVAVSDVDTNVVLVSQLDLGAMTTSIQRSMDGGNSFTQVSNVGTNMLLFNPNNNDTVYAATGNGMYRSINNGQLWQPWVLGGVNILAIHYFDGAVYAGTEIGEVYRVDDASAIAITGSWSRPVEVKSINTLGSTLFIGLNGAEQDTTYDLSGSIWQTFDEGGSWFEITSDMTNTNVYGKNVIDTDGNELYVATYGGGIFRSNGLILSANDGARDPSSVGMTTLNSFPNPTSGMVTLNLPANGRNEVKLLDASGQLLPVALPISGSNDQLHVDLSSIPNGMYFLQVDGNIVGKVNKQ